jgi:hypothetical protein
MVIVVATPGCQIVKTTAAMPERSVAVLFPGGKSDQPEPGELQQGVMRVADTYIGATTASVDELMLLNEAWFSRRRATEFKLAASLAGISVATRENPYAGLFDAVSLVTLTRMSLEYHQTTLTHGFNLDRWVRRSVQLESNVWALAGQVLAPEQQEELRRSVEAYYQSNLEVRESFLVQPLRMASALPRTMQTQKAQGGLLDLSAFDPFASLDPAVREIAQSRLFAERAMFTIQRMPLILRGQAELFLLDAASQPEVARALLDLDRFSESVDRATRAVEVVSRTASELPDRIASERQALVQVMEQQGAELTALLTAATALSDSLSMTITNTEVLMKRFGVGEPKPPGTPAPPRTNAKPFDILEYALAAEKATALAQQLDSVVSKLNTTIESPGLENVSTQATSEVRRLLNHGFLLAAGLVVLVFACALGYRVVARRRSP